MCGPSAPPVRTVRTTDRPTSGPDRPHSLFWCPTLVVQEYAKRLAQQSGCSVGPNGERGRVLWSCWSERGCCKCRSASSANKKETKMRDIDEEVPAPRLLRLASSSRVHLVTFARGSTKTNTSFYFLKCMSGCFQQRADTRRGVLHAHRSSRFT